MYVDEAPGGASSPGGSGRPTRWVSLARACELLGVNESTVRRWADSGEIQVFRTPGGHRRFAEAELLAMIQGGGGRRSDRPLSDAATSRIRHQLHSGSADEWYGEIEQAERDALRPLGRRLLEIVDDYISRRGRRNELEEEVGEIGEQYGRELRRRGTPLAQAVQAFIFFRKSLDETAKRLSERNRLSPEDAEKAREAIAGLADRALIGLTSVYDTEAR
ncbi:MAG: helix-turn-helix domain-containing protein [Chloroflexota bacterium]